MLLFIYGYLKNIFHSLSLLDIGASLYIVLIAVIIGLSPNKEETAYAECSYRLPKRGKHLRKDFSEEWKMKFQGKWELTDREHLEEYMVWDRKLFVVRLLAAVVPVTLFMSYTNDHPDLPVHIQLTSMPSGGDWLLTPTAVPKPCSYRGRNTSMAIDWTNSSLVMTIQDPHHKRTGGRTCVVVCEMISDWTLLATITMKYADDNSSNYFKCTFRRMN